MDYLPMTPYLLAVVPAVVNSVVVKKKVSAKGIVAIFIYGVLLAVLAGWRADVANALAWTVAASSILINGVPLFQTIGKAL